MLGGFQPDPVVLGFFFVKKFVYLQVLGALALVRVLMARGLARAFAAIVCVVAACATLTVFAPALGLAQGPVYRDAARLLAQDGGMAALLTTSGLLAASALMPGAMVRWVDALHGVAFVTLVGLWVYTGV